LLFPVLATVASRGVRGGRSPSRRCVRATVVLGSRPAGRPVRRCRAGCCGGAAIRTPAWFFLRGCSRWSRPRSGTRCGRTRRARRRDGIRCDCAGWSSPAGRVACGHCSSSIRATRVDPAACRGQPDRARDAQGRRADPPQSRGTHESSDTWTPTIGAFASRTGARRLISRVSLSVGFAT
jgi:hypothetical protein